MTMIIVIIVVTLFVCCCMHMGEGWANEQNKRSIEANRRAENFANVERQQSAEAAQSIDAAIQRQGIAESAPRLENGRGNEPGASGGGRRGRK